MISKKTVAARPRSGAAKPAAPPVGAAKPTAPPVGAAAPAIKTAIAAKKLPPAAKKVAPKRAVSKAVPARPLRGASVPTPPVQDSPFSQDGIMAAVSTLTEVPVKVRTPRPVRDRFTMSAADYAMLGELKQTCLEADYEVKKSELVRVGIALAARLDIVALKDLLAALPPVKPDRAKKV